MPNVQTIKKMQMKQSRAFIAMWEWESRMAALGVGKPNGSPSSLTRQKSTGTRGALCSRLDQVKGPGWRSKTCWDFCLFVLNSLVLPRHVIKSKDHLLYFCHTKACLVKMKAASRKKAMLSMQNGRIQGIHGQSDLLHDISDASKYSVHFIW